MLEILPGDKCAVTALTVQAKTVQYYEDTPGMSVERNVKENDGLTLLHLLSEVQGN